VGRARGAPRRGRAIVTVVAVEADNAERQLLRAEPEAPSAGCGRLRPPSHQRRGKILVTASGLVLCLLQKVFEQGEETPYGQRRREEKE